MKRKYLSLSAVIAAVVLLFILGDACILRKVTGLPCPSCGMTRAYLALFRGDIHSAFAYHPLFVLVPIIGVIVCFKRAKNCIPIFIFAIAVFCAVYIVRMVLYFPHTSPMEYNAESYMAKIYFLLRRISA